MNIFNFDGEKAKKLNLKNTIIDAEHAFFGAHCDFFISNDKQCLKKAAFLNAEINVKTQCLKLEEFLNYAEGANSIYIDNFPNFISVLLEESSSLKEFEIHPHSRKSKQLAYLYKPQKPILSYFNRLQVDRPKDNPKLQSGFVLYKYQKSNLAGMYASFIEISSILKKILMITGADNNGFTELNKKDLENFENTTYRRWTTEHFDLSFGINNVVGLFIRLDLLKSNNDKLFYRLLSTLKSPIKGWW